MFTPQFVLSRYETSDQGTFGVLQGEGLSLHTAETLLDVIEDNIGEDFKDWSGQQVYEAISAHSQSLPQEFSTREDSQQAASGYLNSLGIKGIRYLDGTSRSSGEGSHNYVVFDDSAIQILETYYQNRGDSARGYTDFTNPQAVIGFFKKANASTPIHELAHFFLNNLQEAVQLADAPEWASERLKRAALSAAYRAKTEQAKLVKGIRAAATSKSVHEGSPLSVVLHSITVNFPLSIPSTPPAML